LYQTPLVNSLNDRKWCILQVLDGYCVVIAGRRPKSAFYQGSRSEKQILSDLQFASQVFAELKSYAEGPLQAMAVGTVSATNADPTSQLNISPTPITTPELVQAPVSNDQPQSPFGPPPQIGPQQPIVSATAPTATTPPPGLTCLGVIGRLISAGIGAVLMLGGVVGVCMYGGDLFWGLFCPSPVFCSP